MAERKRSPLNPYQLPLDLRPASEHVDLFVRALKDERIIRTPHDAATYLLTQVFTPFEQFVEEQMVVLLLNQRNRITHDVMVYQGTVNTVYIRPAEIFRQAIIQNSPSIILSHNHPSGNPAPSPEDINMTKRIFDAGQILDIELIDHIIVGQDTYYSLKESKQGFDI